MIVSLNEDLAADGNYGYSPECLQYPSIKAAINAFWRTVDGERRADSRGFIGYLFRGSITDCTDIYPDYQLTVGPRGGIRCEKIS